MLKGIWDELQNYKPIPSCSCGCRCGALHSVAESQQAEYVMQFLMGLNDSFAQVHTQILLSIPLPPINKVFSLILQEERQRGINLTSTPTIDSIALISRQPVVGIHRQYTSRAKERSQCSHCGNLGHTVDRCYKLIGYPPGYRNKTRPPLVANVIGSTPQNYIDALFEPISSALALNSNSTALPFTPEQC